MRWLILLALGGCVEQVTPGGPAGPGPGPEPTPDPPQTPVEVVLQPQPGWRVTTSRLVDHSAPTAATVISDGSIVRLIGTASDVFIATMTDETGALIEKHAMQSPCTRNGSRQLRVPQDFATIQSAIDAAQPGDTVKVMNGSYRESLTMKAGVCLLGSGSKHTILDAGGQPRTLVDLTSAPGAVVSGFTLRGTTQDIGCAQPADPFACSGDWYHAAIYLGGQAWRDATVDAPPVISDNVFEGNDVGVMFYWHGIAELRNNLFVGNRVGFVANHYQDRTLVENNVFFNNTDLAIGNQAAYLDIYDNVIMGSSVGIRFEYIQTGHIGCNIFFANAANQADDYVAPPRFTIGVDGNVEIEPKFVGNGDFHLDDGSPGKDHGCDDVTEPDDTHLDIGAYGGPLALSPDFGLAP